MTDLDFPDRLALTLDALADTVTVIQPDPTRLGHKAEPSRTPQPGKRDRMLLVAACLAAAVVVGGAVAVVGNSRTPNSAEPRSDLGAATERAAADTEIVLWLDVYITPDSVADLARALELDTRLTSIEYFDRDATYDEFLQFFADEPELTALVEADQLPTSFRVVVGAHDVDDVMQWAARQPGVVDVERLDGPEPSGRLQTRADIEVELASRRDLATRAMAVRLGLQAQLDELEALGDEPGEIPPGLEARIRETQDAITDATVRLDSLQSEIDELDSLLRTMDRDEN